MSWTRAYGLDLSEARLDGAILMQTQFEGANLTNASFRGAQLVNTNLNQTQLKGLITQGMQAHHVLAHGAKNVPPEIAPPRLP